MLAVGRALVLNPRVMLLDEPLEGLAPIIVDELLAALRRIIRDEGMSAILVEQNAKKILGVTDHGHHPRARLPWSMPPTARRLPPIARRWKPISASPTTARAASAGRGPDICICYRRVVIVMIVFICAASRDKSIDFAAKHRTLAKHQS